jgi:hypothetical protein
MDFLIPIVATQLGYSGLAPLRPTLRRPPDDRPPHGVKARRALRWWTMVAFHKEYRVSLTIAVGITFRNKIRATCGPGCLSNGMKTPRCERVPAKAPGGTDFAARSQQGEQEPDRNVVGDIA